jgi:hypothetical protein
MKHTKGEWSIDEYTPSDIKNSNEELIAKAYGFYEKGKYTYTDECLANAKLIAAAPDLLEVLIKLKEWEKTNFIEQSLLEKINNAINKATL